MEKLEPKDRVKVGFTAGTVERVEGAWAWVTLDDTLSGTLPHRVPVTSVRKLEAR